MNILFMNEKGGTGKTTVAWNMAVEFQRNNYNTILVDMDKQRSLTNINELREKDKFTAASLTDIEKGNINIIDAGGRDSVEMREALTIADLVFIVSNVSQLDLFAVERIKNLVNKGKGFNNFREFYILNRIPANPFLQKEIKDFLDFCKDSHNIIFLPEAICERVIYKRSIQDGLSAPEVGTDEKATKEVKGLFINIKKLL